MTFTFEPTTHIYYLDGKPLSGVTSVLNVIAKPALIGWSARMATEYVRDNLKDLENLEEVLEQAKNAHRRKKDDAAQKGTDIHAWIEEWIAGKDPDFPKDEQAVKQIEQFLSWVEKEKVEFLESEKRMYSEKLWLGGTCDAVAMIGGKKYVVDFKTQEKMWDSVPFIQIAAYTMMLEEMGEKFDGGLVVLLPKKGKLQTYYRDSLESEKTAFLACLGLYRYLTSPVKENNKK